MSSQNVRIEQLDGILARIQKDMDAASAKRAKILEERKLFEQKVEVDRENMVRRAETAQHTLSTLEQRQAEAMEDRKEAQERKSGAPDAAEANIPTGFL